MKPFLPEQPWEPLRLPREKRASVLLITLSFVLLITVITVAFLVRSRSSLQTSQSYSKEIVAQEIGEIAVDKLSAEFQAEISKATLQTPPLSLPLPVRVGVTVTDPRASALVRRTTGDTAAYNSAYTTAGFTTVPHSDRASTISTDTPAKNGWRFDKKRWAKPGLFHPGETYTPPDWVYAYGQPRSNTSAAQDKMTDIIGRYAAMVYDVSGLFDINEAGSTLPLGDKGSSAFADLAGFFTAVSGSSDFSKFATWRSTTPGTTNDFYGNPTVDGPTGAGRIESPASMLSAGQNRFFSRMDFIEAATGTNSSALGLTSDLLPYFRTRSQATNRVSAEDLFILSGTAPTPLSGTGLQPVSATATTTFKVTRIDGTTETYTVKKGNFLFPNRFPLARLRWLADRKSDGTPQHQTEIKKYFGLTWDTTNNIFIYTSPDQATAVSHIKTLQEVATGINSGAIAPREPDFFEWLKAAIDPSSLGQTGGTTDRAFASIGNTVAWEASKDLHLIRIGANIIDQADAHSIPTGIRTQFTGVDIRTNPTTPATPPPFDSYGQKNLPYVNEVILSVLRNTSTDPNLNGYMQFELWNPNRNAATGSNPPCDYQGNPITNYRVRILKGQVVMDPMVYMRAVMSGASSGNEHLAIKLGTNAWWPNSTSAENFNSAWSSLKAIVALSQRNLGFGSYTCPDLSGSTLSFSLGASGSFFNEPYLVNGNLTGNNSVDATNPHDMVYSTRAPQLTVTGALFGNAPDLGKNAILLCSVIAPNPAFAGVTGTSIWTSTTYNTYSAWLKGGKIGPAPPQPVWYPWFDQPSGQKAFNAVQFYSDGLPHGVANKSTEPVTFALELQDSKGTWHTYQIYNNLSLGTRDAGTNGPSAVLLSGHPQYIGVTMAQITSNEDKTIETAEWINNSDTTSSCFGSFSEWQDRKGYPNTDPRTERFSLTDQIYATPGLSIQPTTDAFGLSGLAANRPIGLCNSVGKDFNSAGAYVTGTAAPGWTLYTPLSEKLYFPADLAVNSGTGNAPCSYKDGGASGVLRPADARWVSAEAHPALPVASFPNAALSRPIILNRPFRNVAELGCVFRDIPWKSLDLFSPVSPDRRLLDVFCIEDRATTTGKINPNLATQETLSALLQNTGDAPSTNGVPLTSGTVPSNTVSQVAALFAGLDLSGGPVVSSSNYIRSNANIAQRLATSPASKPDGGYSPYKTQAESFARALSSMTDTRSWQLMLDVVAQSGKIPPQDAAQGNLGGFVVDGQRRFFVYLTLDRLTGEILDKHIEPVYE